MPSLPLVFGGRLASVSTRCAVAALGQGKVGGVSDSVASRDAWGKQNRDDVRGGRSKTFPVRMSTFERAALDVKARRFGISVARLLVESALSDAGDSRPDRQAMILELTQIRTLLGRVSSNINQIARHANASSEFPDDAEATVRAMRQLMLRIDGVVQDVAQGGARS